MIPEEDIKKMKMRSNSKFGTSSGKQIFNNLPDSA